MFESRYGITEDDLDNILLEQDYCCAICTQPLDNSKWVIDHDHRVPLSKDTKRFAVRGILCSKCNTGLGQFNDDIDLVHNALVYLEVYETDLRKKAKKNKELGKAIEGKI